MGGSSEIIISLFCFNKTQRQWLNQYNERCLRGTGEYLKERGKIEAYEWLEERTHGIPDEPHWDTPFVDSGAQLTGSVIMVAVVAFFSRL